MRSVLICSTDRTLTRLLQLNLRERGFASDVEEWDACCGEAAAGVNGEPDFVVTDLNCPEPECWAGLPRARARYTRSKLIVLTYAWPSLSRAEPYQPCALIRKPFAIGELFSLLKVSVAV